MDRGNLNILRILAFPGEIEGGAICKDSSFHSSLPFVFVSAPGLGFRA